MRVVVKVGSLGAGILSSGIPWAGSAFSGRVPPLSEGFVEKGHLADVTEL